MKRGSIVFGIVALLLLADGAYLDATNNQVGGDQGAFFGNANVVLSAGTTVLVAGGLLAIGAIIMWFVAVRRERRGQQFGPVPGDRGRQQTVPAREEQGDHRES
jgi:hypothetical protein